MSIAKIEMTPTQQQWINDKTRELLIEGSAGSGKTIFACFKVLKYGLEHKNASIYIYRKTMPSLKRTSLQEIRNILYKYHIPHEENKSEGKIVLTQTKSTLFFGALDALEKVRSINADMIYIEQAEELHDTTFYTELMLRLGRGEASKEKNGWSQMLLVVQPEDDDHWIYLRYHKYDDAETKYEHLKRKNTRENKPIKSYDEILTEIQSRRKKAHFSYEENLKLPKFQKDYYDDLKYENYDLWLRYSQGIWGKLTGVIYENWDTEWNIPVTGFDTVSFGADFGFVHPAAFLLGGFYKGDAYIIDEVYHAGLTTPQLIDECTKMLFKNKLLPEQLDTGFGDAADPDSIEQFCQAGYPMEKSVKNVTAKINTTKQTKIHIHPQCVNTIKEIKGYVYKTDKNGKSLEEPVKDKDHAMDALAYMCYGVKGPLSPNKPFQTGGYNRVRVY